jgi:hypothetical protein
LVCFAILPVIHFRVPYIERTARLGKDKRRGSGPPHQGPVELVLLYGIIS